MEVGLGDFDTSRTTTAPAHTFQPEEHALFVSCSSSIRPVRVSKYYSIRAAADDGAIVSDDPKSTDKSDEWCMLINKLYTAVFIGTFGRNPISSRIAPNPWVDPIFPLWPPGGRSVGRSVGRW